MLADFYIPRLSNDMKLIIWKKNHSRGQILYRSLVPSNKTPSIYFPLRSPISRAVIFAGWFWKWTNRTFLFISTAFQTLFFVCKNDSRWGIFWSKKKVQKKMKNRQKNVFYLSRRIAEVLLSTRSYYFILLAFPTHLMNACGIGAL